ncbi:MAG: transaldolase [Pelagibacterales bacterium MED-G40]|nr:MAG: transaldolase [Pelagibacterales bacterium MED-G40]
MKTKIFCDIADSKTIKQFNKKSIVDGFTTNPSLMRKAGAKSYEKYSKLLLKICKKKPISLEVFADNFKDMEEQAYKINSWGKNIYVKIPVINSKGKFTGQLIKKLNKKKIKLNITAVYTLDQVKKINRCLDNKTKSIISVFSGRMADVGKDPVPIIKKAVQITSRKNKVEILWASTREPYNYTQAKQLECQIITMPPNVIEKVLRFGKSFNQLTTDTVKAFLIDSKKSRFKI